MLSFKLSSCWFWTIFHRKTSKMFQQLFNHFVFTTQTTQPHPQVLSVNSLIWHFWLHFWCHRLNMPKYLPNRVPCSCLWWIMHVLLTNKIGWDASPSQGYPPPLPAVCRRIDFETQISLHWRETKWSKVPCLRNNATVEAWTPDLQIQSSRC